MIKNSFIKIVFLLILGISCVYPQISHAANCTEEEVNKINESTKTSMQNAVDILTNAANNFNSAAESYINSCKTPAEKANTREAISSKTAAIAQANGVDYDNDRIWKYTAYDWQKEIAPNKNGCYDKLKTVKEAQGKLMDNKNLAEIAISRADALSKRETCKCSEAEPDAINICIKNADEELAKMSSDCKSFTQYQNEFGGTCMLCPIFRVILNTVSRVSSVAWNAVSEPLSDVVKIIFLVLLAIEVLKAVGAVAGSKISALAKGVLVLSAKVAFTLLLLGNASYIYGYFLSPVLEGGLEMGIKIANASAAGGHCAAVSEGNSGISSDTFSPKLYDTVLSTVDCFGKTAAMMPAIGRGLTCNAWKDTNWGVPNLSMWFAGVIMYLLGILIWLAVSFYMIDCTVQIGMLSGLVPLLIACWPFKLTETYTYKGCKMLMNSFFTYAMVGIVLLIGTAITTFAVGGGDVMKLQMALNNEDIDTLRELCDLGALQILILAACAIFAMKLIGQTGNLADQFSKGAGSDIGAKLGGTATSAATGMAKSIGKTGLKALKGIGKYASEEVGLTAAINKGKDAVTGAWQKGWAKAGRGVGLGRFQNKQTGSGLESGEGGGYKPEDAENKKPEDTKNQEKTNEKTDTSNQEENSQ